MKRPTIRMSDVLADYVEECFRVTSLDRNQIIRLLMVTAPSSKLFQQKITRYLKPGKSIPVEPWKAHQDDMWLKQDGGVQHV